MSGMPPKDSARVNEVDDELVDYSTFSAEFHVACHNIQKAKSPEEVAHVVWPVITQNKIPYSEQIHLIAGGFVKYID